MSLLYKLDLPWDIKNLSYEELEKLSFEVRKLMIETVSKNGGHLASSLGATELTLALLKVFDLKKDLIVWDVGHQAYAYKILTDRRDKFSTLRTYKGISGFIKSDESKFDAFSVGHSSTSISAALGLKSASDYLKIERFVIAIIGDGSISSGLAFEAINNLSQLDKHLIVILNDNEMCISHNVGALSSYLSRIMSGEFYTKFRRDLKNLFLHAPMGGPLMQLAKKIEEGLIGFFTPGILFDELGLKYIGPINGHNIKELQQALYNATLQDGPVLIHIWTKKGAGYPYAEKNPSKFHSISAFDIDTGNTLKTNVDKSYSQIAGESVCKLALADERIVTITAAMTDGVGLTNFSKLYPDRFFDVGIAEAHGATFAAGLAKLGLKPFYFVYSTFLQRAFDQLVHDIALQNLPVKLLIDRAGLVGDDGPTHHGVFDISYIRLIPNFAMMVPKDSIELEEMISLSLKIDGPCAIRYPRGTIETYENFKEELLLYKPQIIFKDGEIAIISVGHIFSEALKLHNLLLKEFGCQSLINLRFIKPLNVEYLVDVVKDKELIVIIEENSSSGGAGEMLTAAFASTGIKGKILNFGIPDKFVEHGSVRQLRETVGMVAENMFKVIETCVKSKIR